MHVHVVSVSFILSVYYVLAAIYDYVASWTFHSYLAALTNIYKGSCVTLFEHPFAK